MTEPLTLFITWTTYGTWLPGDARGWRKTGAGEQQSQPRLEQWCRQQMHTAPVVLNSTQRERVASIIRTHSRIRGWELHAVSVRSNHAHVAVTANAPIKQVRDQFKANATRVLKQPPDALTYEKVWTRGGDIEILNGEDELEQVVIYITQAQDRMQRDTN